jgi:hypothetical protein
VPGRGGHGIPVLEQLIGAGGALHETLRKRRTYGRRRAVHEFNVKNSTVTTPIVSITFTSQGHAALL